MNKGGDEDLLKLAFAINDELQKTFSRYTELKNNRMPENFESEFFPKHIEEVVTYVPEPVAEPQAYQNYAQPQAPAVQAQVQPPVVQANLAMEQIMQESNEPAPQMPPPREVQPEVKRPIQAKPAAVPADVFDILGSGDSKPEKEDFFNAPMKPATADKESPKKDGTISKLNEIMAKMQQEEMEQKQKKEMEEKQQKEMMFNAFQPPMMNPAWMAYATSMPGARPMAPGPNNFATNMPFPGGMPPVMNPMFQARFAYPMSNMTHAIPQVTSE